MSKIPKLEHSSLCLQAPSSELYTRVARNNFHVNTPNSWNYADREQPP